MKKIILVFVFAFGVYLTSFGQKKNEQPYFALDFKGSFKPFSSENSKEKYKFGAGANLEYYFLHLTDEITFGSTAGLEWYKGNSPVKDAYFVPVGVSINIDLAPALSMGVKAGYNIGLANTESGFYYRGYFGMEPFQILYSSIQLATGNISAFQISLNIPLSRRW